MAVYSSRYNYLFVCGPLCAAQAVQRVLLAELDGELLPPQDVVRNGKVIAKKQATTYKMLQLAELLSQDELDQALKFSIVRNPFDLLVARYLRRLGELGQAPRHAAKSGGDPVALQAVAELSFEQWLRQSHGTLIAQGTPAKGQAAFTDKADLLLRYEDLQTGFDQVLAQLGVRQPVLLFPDADRPPPAPLDYRPIYTPQDRALVEQLYAAVLDQHGYRFT
jgi:hypothetical protein